MFQERRRRFLGTTDGRDAAQSEAKKLIDAIRAAKNSVERAIGHRVSIQNDVNGPIMANADFSVCGYWTNFNRPGVEDAVFKIDIWDGPPPARKSNPGSGEIHTSIVKGLQAKVDLTEDGSVVWKSNDSDTLHSTNAFAEKILLDLLKVVEKLVTR